MSEKKPIVLFLCSANSARSQMAEALLRDMAGDQFEIHSAGIEAKDIRPLAREAIEEIGLSMEGQRPTAVDEYLGKLPVDYLIVVCGAAAEQCPSIWPGSPRMERIVWPFEDPAAAEGSEEERLQKFREVRDHIREKLETWLATRQNSSA